MEEVSYPGKYDLMKMYLDDDFEMPDKTIALVAHFGNREKDRYLKEQSGIG